MNKLLMSSVIVASSLFTIAAYAQSTMTNPAVNNMPHSNMHQQHKQMQINMMSNMASMLDLTADQQAQIQAIRQNNRGNHMQNSAAIIQVLTPDQRQKLQQIQSQRMNRGDIHHSQMMYQDQAGRINQGGRMDLSE